MTAGWLARARVLGRDFLLVVSAQLVSVAGTQVTMLALPTIAVLHLHAGATATSALLTVEYLPAAVLGPLVGVLVDRLPLRPILVGSDLVRAATLCSVPAAAAAGVLSLGQLFAVAAVVGIATVPFDTAASTAVPHLVPAGRLSAANSYLGSAQAAGRISGPGLGGVLVGAFGATTAVVADVASYGASAALLSLLGAARTRERPAQEAPLALFREARAGLAVVRADPVLARGMLGTALLNLGGAGMGGLFFLFAYNRLGLTPGEVGISLTVYSVGSLAGALGAPLLGRLLRPGNAVLILSAVAGASLFLIPAASAGAPLALIIIYQAVFATAATAWVVLLTTMRQQRTPAAFLGRVSALSQAIATVTFPVGTALAAVLASVLGLVPALIVLAAIAATTPVCYLAVRFRNPVAATGTPGEMLT